MYIIVNDDNSIMRIKCIPLFGHKVEMLACFYNETDALKILYEVETELEIKGHRIENTGDGFYIEPDAPMSHVK
jgi:hypothetical protein